MSKCDPQFGRPLPTSGKFSVLYGILRRIFYCFKFHNTGGVVSSFRRISDLAQHENDPHIACITTSNSHSIYSQLCCRHQSWDFHEISPPVLSSRHCLSIHEVFRILFDFPYMSVSNSRHHEACLRNQSSKFRDFRLRIVEGGICFMRAEH